MRTGHCLPLCLVLMSAPSLIGLPSLAVAQTAVPSPAAGQGIGDWSAQGASSENAAATWTLLSTPAAIEPPRQRDTTHSIPVQPVPRQGAGRTATVEARAAAGIETGWSLSTDEATASLSYVASGKVTPFGFACRRGDGFATFRTPPGSYQAGKKVHVQLRSRNGAIKLDASAGPDRSLQSEVPIRTSSLVFVLTPKIDPARSRKKPHAGEAKLTVGGWTAEVPQALSDVKLLRFQSLCEQPVASAE